MSRILLTSFDVWKPEHRSNASDDLLDRLTARNLLPQGIHLLRKLPVDFQRAPETVIAEMESVNPSHVVCCGMAEKRELLTVESNGKHQDAILTTDVNMEALIEGLPATAVSHDAGSFVCNHLYYCVLRYVREHQLTIPCIFVHVPVLNQSNCESIVSDFSTILQRLCTG